MITIEFPMKLPSVSNLREHWATKAKRVKAQRAVTRITLRGVHFGYRQMIPLAVTLTRVAPRKLDDDNLRGAFKAVRDEIAAYFGVDDGSKEIEWHYAQAKGKAAVRIGLELEPLPTRVVVV